VAKRKANKTDMIRPIALQTQQSRAAQLHNRCPHSHHHDYKQKDIGQLLPWNFKTKSNAYFEILKFMTKPELT
jgi:hypothetical protein